MVEIENLSLSYGNNKEVLKNISLNIEKGECVLLNGLESPPRIVECVGFKALGREGGVDEPDFGRNGQIRVADRKSVV